MKQACPSTEQIQSWWNQMQTNGATKIYAVKDHDIFRLRAYTNSREKRGELSIGLKDAKLAKRIANSLAITIDDNSPTSVISKYIDHLKLREKTCLSGKYVNTTLAKSVKQNISTIRSRLTAHLIPFCQKKHISDIKAMFRREIIRAYLDELKESIAISDSARSIMASTLTFLRWYDGKQDYCLMDSKFYAEIKGWRGYFGDKRKRSKLFLSREQIQTILRYNYQNERVKAMFLLPLTCGVRYNEMINIRWCDLDMKKGNMKITAAKGGRTRKCQLPKFIQAFLVQVRENRPSGTLPGDYLFTDYNRNRDLAIYKKILKDITKEDCNDMSSNCLRRSGCNLIERHKHGLGDMQLGHSTCTRTTYRSYIDSDDYQEVNDFWDDFYRDSISQKPIMSLSTLKPFVKEDNLIQFSHLGTEVG